MLRERRKKRKKKESTTNKLSDDFTKTKTDSMDMSLRKLQKLVMDREGFPVLQSMGFQRVGHN